MAQKRSYHNHLPSGITIEKVSGAQGPPVTSNTGYFTGSGTTRYKVTWSGTNTLTPKQAAATQGQNITGHEFVLMGMTYPQGPSFAIFRASFHKSS